MTEEEMTNFTNLGEETRKELKEFGDIPMYVLIGKTRFDYNQFMECANKIDYYGGFYDGYPEMKIREDLVIVCEKAIFVREGYDGTENYRRVQIKPESDCEVLDDPKMLLSEYAQEGEDYAIRGKDMELKPCPFCGGKAKIYYLVNETQPAESYSSAEDIGIHCTECYAGISDNILEHNGEAWNTERIVKKWNARVKE